MNTPPAPNFSPTRICAVDVATGIVEQPLPLEREVSSYRYARVLVRLSSIPIGFVTIDNAPTEDQALVAAVRVAALHDHGPLLDTAFTREDLPAPTTPGDLARYQPRSALDVTRPDPTLVSVAVSALHNDEAALATVDRILRSDHKNLDIVIVDNSDSLEPLATKVAARYRNEPRVRHVLEPRRGLSRARNKGLAVARGDIIVFTDDDVLVDRFWITRIVEAFHHTDNVGCVTGAIIPAELETPSQDWLEQFGGFNKGFELKVFNASEHTRPEPLYPYDSGRLGSGANMAFRRSTLDAIGGFANDLGAGTPAWGGEDIDILRRVITGGFTIVYSPGALLWHRHRRSYDALRKQMYRYGVGLSATVTKWLVENTHTRTEVLRRIPLGLRHVLSPHSAKNQAKSSDYPRILTVLELLGLASGPAAYFRSRRRTAEVDQRHNRGARVG